MALTTSSYPIIRSADNWRSCFDFCRGIVLVALEVLVEHLRNFIEIYFVFLLVNPAGFGVQNTRVNPRNILGVAKVENWKFLILCVFEYPIMDGVHDRPRGSNAHTLNRSKTTLPTP